MVHESRGPPAGLLFSLLALSQPACPQLSSLFLLSRAPSYMDKFKPRFSIQVQIIVSPRIGLGFTVGFISFVTILFNTKIISLFNTTSQYLFNGLWIRSKISDR